MLNLKLLVETLIYRTFKQIDALFKVWNDFGANTKDHL